MLYSNTCIYFIYLNIIIKIIINKNNINIILFEDKKKVQFRILKKKKATINK